MGITSAIMIISGIGIIAAVVLVLAAKFMHVEEDERIGNFYIAFLFDNFSTLSNILAI